ncbi:hypothetical protein MKX01_013385 [Papaver californicum]|nr:hypothetical protein MKX01_013385 [Papaver californicum]
MKCALKRIRGKDDTKARAVAGFTSGYMLLMVGSSSANRASEATVIGLIFALCCSLLHKVFPPQLPVLDNKCYTRTKCMLSNLGLQKYEKHFKKHLLTDNTMSLLNHSDLAEARIPLGPRVLILNDVRRDPDIRNMREA